MSYMNRSFFEEYGCSLSEFARRHGLHRDTVRWRWKNGKKLSGDPRDRYKKILGKTCEQWSVWFACRGIEKTANQVRASFWYCKNQYQLTDAQAMDRVKRIHFREKKHKHSRAVS